MPEGWTKATAPPNSPASSAAVMVTRYRPASRESGMPSKPEAVTVTSRVGNPKSASPLSGVASCAAEAGSMPSVKRNNARINDTLERRMNRPPVEVMLCSIYGRCGEFPVNDQIGETQ